MGNAGKSMGNDGFAHPKVLNSSKGPAVRGPRCQADRVLYKKAINSDLKTFANIEVFSKMVSSLVINKYKIEGIILEKKEIALKEVQVKKCVKKEIKVLLHLTK